MTPHPIDRHGNRSALREVRHRPSHDRQWRRFSFGPPMDHMQMALVRLQEMLREA